MIPVAAAVAEGAAASLPPPPDILLLNANTDAALTARMVDAARPLAPGCRGATVARGARYISDAAAAGVARQAVLECVDALAPDALPDVLVIACFGDPALWDLRARGELRVVGMAEASCHAACQIGRRFAIVTGGAAWEPMLRGFIDEIGLSARLSGIHTLELAGDALAANPEAALPQVAAGIGAAHRGGADVVILGGAGLVGFAARLQAQARVPLLDSLSCAVAQALACHAVAPGLTPRAGRG